MGNLRSLTDSLDKIVHLYCATVAREPFVFEGERFVPKPLVVSPQLLRGYTCPANCGGCCSRPYSLVWLPSERRPSARTYGKVVRGIVPHTVTVNGRTVTLCVDMQDDAASFAEVPGRCKHLRKADGRCGIHGVHPFSCDFELIRVKQFSDHNVLGQQLFGRGWALTRVTGERGAACSMTDVTRTTIADTARRLRRLLEWTDYFGLVTHLPTILAWVERGPHAYALRLAPDGTLCSADVDDALL